MKTVLQFSDHAQLFAGTSKINLKKEIAILSQPSENQEKLTMAKNWNIRTAEEN